MGFGILFLGYLITYIGSLTPIYAYLQVVGVLIMLYALTRLFRHNKNFSITFYIGLLYFAQSVMTLVFSFFNPDENSVLYQIEKYSSAGIVLIFHLFLLLAIRDIAVSTSLPKLRSRAIRNLIMSFVYYGLTLLLPMGLITDQILLQYASLTAVILGFLWLIFNAALIFSCYMWICLEGEENMERSPINIPFINAANDFMNQGLDKMKARREEKNKEYMDKINKKRKK